MLGHRAARRHLVVRLALVGSLLAAGACRPADVPRQRAPLSVADVEPEYRDGWRDVLQAQRRDPASDEVIAAANRLLARDPPSHLRAAALLAKAQQAYLTHADARAITWSDDGLAEAESHKTDPEVRSELWRVSVSALARGGEPAAALTALKRAESESDMPTVELRGAMAVASDRSGDAEAALVAFAAWRELLAADSAEAAYADSRFSSLAARVGADRLRSLSHAATSPAIAACLGAAGGEALPSVGGDWTEACRRLPQRVGILLPRTGALAGLADRHFAAVTASVRVLADEREVELLWEDAGSDARTAGEAAERLVGRGVDVVIGPVGRGNVAAATRELELVLAVLPGESVGDGLGVAPSLEDRAASLLQYAKRHASGHGVIVLAPDNGYGHRGVAGLPRGHGASVHFYPASTTTFKPHLDADLARVRKGATVIVIDAMPRLELIVRQLRSLGVDVGSGSDSPLVLSSGEGLHADDLANGREVFDGVVLAPTAAPSPASAAFEDEYRRQQGVGADDQALLVWRALRDVWSGQLPHTPAKPELVRVRGAELVPIKVTK